MQLADVIPIERTESALGKSVTAKRLNTTDPTLILRNNADELFGIASSAWHRLVMAGRFKVLPMQMRQYFEGEDPRLAPAIEKVIRQPLLKEFGFLRATTEHAGKPFTVATSCVAQLYSNELHLYDIAMFDPRYPLSRSRRRSEIQHHRGFGLLNDVMQNIFASARERNCAIVTLTAASRPLVDVFSRYRFTVEQNDFAKSAMKFGVGIPMEAVV
jgi:hypothetical protein